LILRLDFLVNKKNILIFLNDSLSLSSINLDFASNNLNEIRDCSFDEIDKILIINRYFDRFRNATLLRDLKTN